MGLMQSLLRKDRQASGATSKAAQDTGETAPLLVLVPDAQGIATYQLHEFRSARAAEIFVDVTLRGQVNERMVLFWALNGRPSDGEYAEPLVLIRDAASPVVYLFSFADLGSCHDFIRHEMTRGLDLAQVMVFWAVPVVVDKDVWGRAVISPQTPPKSAPVSETAMAEPVAESRKSFAEPPPPSVLPFVSREKSAETARYPTEADIAETIREMDEFTAKFDADRPDVIDFPAASQKILRSSQDARAIAGWENFSHALDEALDVHVSQQVRVRIALNRMMRALAQAGFLHAGVSQKGAPSEPERETTVDATRAWSRASIALADAGTIAIRRALMRRVWMNTAWTLEEAAYAYRLEARARAFRGWRSAGEALAEAAKAREAREAAAVRAWALISTELLAASHTQVATEGARRAWTHAAKALRQAATVAKRRQKVFATTWTRLGRALKNAVAAQEKQRKAFEKAELAAARRAERKEAKAAARAQREATNATAHAGREAEMASAPLAAHRPGAAAPVPVTEEEDLPEGEQISRWLARQEVEHTHEETPGKPKRSRWEPHEEPFQGFQSPPGRF